MSLTRNEALKSNLTPAGKELGCALVNNTALYRIKFKDGGELPEELTGMYTDTHLAQKDIEIYLRRRWDEHEAAQVKQASKKE